MDKLPLEEPREMQAVEASQRTEEEKRRLADELMEQLCDPKTGNGLLLAQLRFMKIRAIQRSGKPTVESTT